MVYDAKDRGMWVDPEMDNKSVSELVNAIMGLKQSQN
jgi:hypothetical protein